MSYKNISVSLKSSIVLEFFFFPKFFYLYSSGKLRITSLKLLKDSVKEFRSFYSCTFSDCNLEEMRDEKRKPCNRKAKRNEESGA